MKNYYILNSKKEVIKMIPVNLPEPIRPILCKNRKTKQRYIMFRTETENSLTAPKLLVPIEYSQYDGIMIACE